MKNTIIAIIVIVVVGIVAYFLFFKTGSTPYPVTNPTYTYTQTETNTPVATTTVPDNSNPPATVIATTTVTVTPTPAPLVASVNIKDFAYIPSTLTVKVGTKVTWTNNDSAPHTVTSDTNALLNSSTLNSGQSYSYTFTTAGTTNYHCSIHPMMTGSVVVVQ